MCSGFVGCAPAQKQPTLLAKRSASMSTMEDAAALKRQATGLSCDRRAAPVTIAICHAN
jgi:hypothetical protein